MKHLRIKILLQIFLIIIYLDTCLQDIELHQHCSGEDSIAACAHNNNKDDNNKIKTTNDDCVCILRNF